MKQAIARVACILVLATLAFASQGQAQEDSLPRFRFSGDFRLRYENNSNDPLSPNGVRNREVFRVRAGATVTINEYLTAGARLVTGDSDDPKTTDVTLSNFLDDLEVSLDQAYIQFAHRGLVLSGGKFPNPFLRAIEVIWDGDVNPQGLAGSYTVPGSGTFTPKATGLFFVVDEQSGGRDSYMGGGQVSVAINASDNLGVTLAGGYYDYTIRSLANAGPGDIRSNNLAPGDTLYLSDFDMLDATAIVTSGAFGERYPIRLFGNYVKNLGYVKSANAEVDEDQGLAVGVYVGKASGKGDRRLHYSYSEAQTDAVLAAFSHDNLTLATNYMLHTLAVDFVPLRNTVLNATWYVYRRKDIATTPNDYISRLRINLLVLF